MPIAVRNVEAANEPQVAGAEERLGRAAQRIQEIDEQMEQLKQERAVMAQDINRAAGELQNSIEKAQHAERGRA